MLKKNLKMTDVKTIEERAKEYVGAPCDDGCAICDAPLCELNEYSAYIAGARSEHEELTRWHDPKELPDTNLQVLVQVESRDGEWWHIALAHVRKGKLVVEGNMIEKGDMIVGWREIHE